MLYFGNNQGTIGGVVMLLTIIKVSDLLGLEGFFCPQTLIISEGRNPGITGSKTPQSFYILANSQPNIDF